MGTVTVNKDRKKGILGRITNSKNRYIKYGTYQWIVTSPVFLEKKNELQREKQWEVTLDRQWQSLKNFEFLGRKKKIYSVCIWSFLTIQIPGSEGFFRKINLAIECKIYENWKITRGKMTK